MEVTTEFDTGHKDMIHDIQFNYYGTRMITCSSDQRLKVFDYENEWKVNDSWKGHDSIILKVSWAHPIFGQVFASCSFDRTIKIWEEQPQELLNSSRRWVEKAKLMSKFTVQDIQFAPQQLGLLLAACSGDGMLRIYEAMDVMNVSNWTLTDEFELTHTNVKESEGQYCLAWCPSKNMIVAGCGKEQAKVYRQDAQNHWQACEVLSGHQGIVRDVAWAPTMGRYWLLTRSFHLIATACSDGHVRIFQLNSKTKPNFTVELVADFAEQVDVWRVEWNVTGTVLTSSADDGTVRLWRSSALKEWRPVATVGAEKTVLR